MPHATVLLAESLARRYKQLDLTRSQVTDLFTRGEISKSTYEHTYEGLFLNAHVAFEGFIEDLFLKLLISGSSRIDHRTGIVPRITVLSFAVAREIVIGPNRQYIDWLPFENTIRLARLYFRGGKPFSELNDTQKTHLLKCHLIRNAVAHKSHYSLEKFERTVIGNTPLPANERAPAGYLSGIFRTAPAQTRYENLTVLLLSIARFLAR